MRVKAIILTAFLCYFTLAVYSQYYNTGQDPASFKWLEVKTGRFNVIYPEDYGQNGIEFARSLERAYNELKPLFPGNKTKIPVIIHNHTTQSNGYVSWAPKRMEIFPTPEENTIPLGTFRQLALHEITHVKQVESLNTGFSKVMSFFLGQQFTGIVTALLPLWYLEGDAVFSETVLTGSGRGRSPSFQNQLKAIAIERGKPYKYDKMLNGSFRDYTPDHYQFGYQMVTWSRLNADINIWNKVRKFTAEEPFTINPVNISLRRSAGLTKKRLYNETFDTLTSLWKNEIVKSRPVKYKRLSPWKHREYLNYYSPSFAGEDSIIAISTSLSEPASFVLLRPSDSTVKKIHIPGYMDTWFLSFAKGRLVWVETTSDPRWENRNYSVIKIKDLLNRSVKPLTFRSRFTAASISPDGKSIAATENTPDNGNNLVIIDPESGSVISRIPSPGNVALQRPQWSGNGKLITVIYLTEEGEGILSCNPTEKIWDTLSGPSTDDLQVSFLRNDSLFYVSSATGTDNIYLKVAGKGPWRLTNSVFGISDISIRGSDLLFCDYSSMGNDICSYSLKNLTRPFEEIEDSSYLIDKFDLNTTSGSLDSDDIEYVARPYRKWQHLFRFHSWMPFYADIEAIQADPTVIRPGITVMSQNTLSTLTTTLGYEYSADRRHLFHSKIRWEGWYPVIESELDYGHNPLMRIQGDSLPGQTVPGVSFINTLSLPFNFRTGKFSQILYLAVTTDYNNQYVYSTGRKLYDRGQTNITGRFYFSNYYKSAYRDIYPRWTQVIDLSYTSAPFDREVYGTDFALRSTFYFPGLFRNHGTRFRYERELMDFAALLTSNRIRFPRGYNNIISGNLSFFSVDYTAPLAYPDLTLGSLLYLTRLRGGFFYDYGRGSGNIHIVNKNGLPVAGPTVNEMESFSSFGLQVVSDSYLFRIPFPITFGAEAVWKSVGEAPSLSLIFNIDIYGMNIGRSKP